MCKNSSLRLSVDGGGCSGFQYVYAQGLATLQGWEGHKPVLGACPTPPPKGAALACSLDWRFKPPRFELDADVTSEHDLCATPARQLCYSGQQVTVIASTLHAARKDPTLNARPAEPCAGCFVPPYVEPN